jgi:hypothetical protein
MNTRQRRGPDMSCFSGRNQIVDVFRSATQTRISFKTWVRYNRRSDGRKLESGGGYVTGTTENQYGDVSSLTTRKYIPEQGTEWTSNALYLLIMEPWLGTRNYQITHLLQHSQPVVPQSDIQERKYEYRLLYAINYKWYNTSHLTNIIEGNEEI